MPDASPVVRKSIPPPGDCVGQNESLIWYCGQCGEVANLLSRRCGNCAEERPAFLEPWVELASRDFRLASSLGGGTDPLGPPHTPAFARFVRSMKLQFESWEAGQTYDLPALKSIAAWERPDVAKVLGDHETTWREAEVLAELNLPESIPTLEAASCDHLSAPTRLAAAAALDRMGKARNPLDVTIAREIRQLANADDSTEKIMALAAQHPTDAVKQALLYASVCATTAAPHCAAMLCMICGKTTAPDDPAIRPLLARLGLHVNSFTRQAAFAELCGLVGMTLET